MPDTQTTPVLLRPRLDALPGWVAAFTTRQGGHSAPPWAALNLSRSVGDDPEAVAANREAVCAALGIAPDHLALAGQVHGATVQAVHAPGLYRSTDGLVTATPGLVLVLTAADCASVLLADPVGGVAGACHAGWRGAASGIVGHTVAAMQALGTRPADVHAYVSPCISADAFEVGEDVAARFGEAHVVRRPAWPRPHVDLKAVLQDQLAAAGVPSAQVEVDPACTVGEVDRFFSHRAEQGRTGRMMGLIGRTGA